jgi:glutathione-regulated potassium-efflux system ancillary protein KefG
MVLVQFAHPRLEDSRVNKALAAALSGIEGLTWNDLYQRYPDFDVDVAAEQELLLGHEVVAVVHPLYWYSCPPLLKQWIDLVLEHGWAYGREGKRLEGKAWLQIVSTGGPAESYGAEGAHRHVLDEFLSPFEQTARLCSMEWLPPRSIHGTHRMSDSRLAAEVAGCVELLSDLARRGGAKGAA